MEHLLRIVSGFELAEHKYVTVENMKKIRNRPTVTYKNDWDPYFLVTGFVEPRYKPVIKQPK